MSGSGAISPHPLTNRSAGPVATLTTNTGLAAMPGNVFLSSTSTGLPRDSVVNVTALATLDRRSLDEHPAGGVPEHLMDEVDSGLRQVLGLA